MKTLPGVVLVVGALSSVVGCGGSDPGGGSGGGGGGSSSFDAGDAPPVCLNPSSVYGVTWQRNSGNCAVPPSSTLAVEADGKFAPGAIVPKCMTETQVGCHFVADGCSYTDDGLFVSFSSEANYDSNGGAGGSGTATITMTQTEKSTGASCSAVFLVNYQEE
jgi:hypothetical protein